MKLSIRNFIAIKQADIDLAKITVVSGRNEAGKSSFCLAGAAATTGRAVPIDELTKTNFPGLIGRKGESTCIILKTDIGETIVEYPECKIFSTGDPFQISEHSAGLTSLANVPKKERARFVGELLKTDPNRDELHTELKKSIPAMADDIIEGLWKNIAGMGWDGALTHCKEVGTRLKGKWETITGEKFGTKKYKDWKPTRWDDDLSTADQSGLDETVTQDREWLEAAISESAVDSSMVSQLEKQASNVSGLTEAVKNITDQLGILRADHEKISTGIRNLPKPTNPETQSCPHCKGALGIESGKIIIPRVLTPEEIAERTETIRAETESLTAVSSEISRLQSEQSRITGDLNVSKSAQRELDKLKTKPAPTAHASVEDLRKQLAESEWRAASFKAWKSASEIAEDIVVNMILQTILDPSGLRLVKLMQVLDRFNSVCASVCKSAAWPVVKINTDMSIYQEQYPYMMISDGAKMRARIVLQLAVAQIVGDKMVIIDKADTMDSIGRNGLVSVIEDMDGISAIIGMTFFNRESVPNFGAVLTDVAVYWIEDGIVSLIK
jgi:hypothetical protein